MRYKPEVIVSICIFIFGLSLFLSGEKGQLAMQVASNAVAGYFGFISNKNEDDNYN